MAKVYARLENGVIAEYPVYPVHLETRGHTPDMYVELTFDERPAAGRFQSVEEKLIINEGKVHCQYKLRDITLDELLIRLHFQNKHAGPLDAESVVTIDLIEVEMINKVIELARKMVQKRLDDFAADKGYDGILSAASYATSQIPTFAAEGQRAVYIRDLCWMALYAYLNEVQSGTAPVPRLRHEIEDRLPELTWL